MDELIENPELDSAEKQQAAKKSTLVSVAVNLGLTTSQIFAGVISGSQGLIADGIHSLSDLVADFVVLFANHHSGKGADDDHHYGHQRYETAASLFLGVSLLVVGLGMLWSAGHKIINPAAPGQIQLLALYVAVGALVVGLMVAKAGWAFSWDALHDLMDRAASVEEHQKIEEIINATEGVRGCHDLRTRKMGDMLLVDVHIEVDANASVKVGHDIAFAAAKKVTDTMPVLNVMTHIDPV